MSLILFAFCAAAFYSGFKCGHKYASLKQLGDGLVARVKEWANQIVK